MEQTVTQGAFVLERQYDATPARVFAAWASPEALQRWAYPGADVKREDTEFDFRTGGVTRSAFIADRHFDITTRYAEVKPDQRIVMSVLMEHDGKATSASVVSVEFFAVDGGCRLILGEAGAFIDAKESSSDHEWGWGTMLDKLEDALKAELVN